MHPIKYVKGLRASRNNMKKLNRYAKSTYYLIKLRIKKSHLRRLWNTPGHIVGTTGKNSILSEM